MKTRFERFCELLLVFFGVLLVAVTLKTFAAPIPLQRANLTFRFSFPDQSTADAILDDFVVVNGWTPQIVNPDPESDQVLIPNPVTKKQFADQLIRSYLMSHVREKRVRDAVEQTREQKETEVDAIDVRREENGR